MEAPNPKCKCQRESIVIPSAMTYRQYFKRSAYVCAEGNCNFFEFKYDTKMAEELLWDYICYERTQLVNYIASLCNRVYVLEQQQHLLASSETHQQDQSQADECPKC